MKNFMKICLISFALISFNVGLPKVSADTINWSGNGTTDGACNKLVRDSSLPPQTLNWQFTLTKPQTGTGSTLSGVFNINSNMINFSVTSLLPTSGNTSVYSFSINTPLDTKLVSASATDGTLGRPGSVLTVSRCSYNN